MAAKKVVNLPDIGEIVLTKRRGNTNIRMSYARDGGIRVSLPYFVPYEAGLAFVRSKTDWLQKHRPAPASQLGQGDRIGKAHRVHFVTSTTATKPTVRVAKSRVQTTLPLSVAAHDSIAQKAVQRGALKALKQEADQLLPQRLDHLAKKHGFSYESVTTKRLSSRWGSCSQHRDITLNIYLMQLPWHLIDYVIVHELVHTEHLNHSPGFWQRFEQIMPTAKQLRRDLKKYPTAIQPSV